MSKHWSALLSVLCVGSATQTAAAAVLWEGDFETGDVSQWDGSELLQTGDRDNLVFVTDDVAEGTQAAQITLREDIVFEPYNQSRVEVRHIGLHTENGEESYFAWSFMVPEAAEVRSNIGYWESTPTSQNTMTFFIEPGDAGTVVGFGTGFLGVNVQWTASLVLGEWHRMAIHNVWSQDAADGRVSVWYDGVQVVNNVVATKIDAEKLFFQMGLHRPDPLPPVQVIYIDAAMEADSLDDILAPLPDPTAMGGSGGLGGTAGVGGSGGASAGTAGSGGSAGTIAGGSGGVAGSAGATGGVSGSGGQAGAPVVKAVRPAATGDSGGCAVNPAKRLSAKTRGGRSWRSASALAGAASRRRRRRPIRAKPRRMWRRAPSSVTLPGSCALRTSPRLRIRERAP